mmetsp:Transcript_18969/g.27520  ORF Transcript_18969/g.27520 Transcript_18969/m.27520 type:complete len:94 (+) Transcript_18969:1131-1412(+)
MRFQTAHTFLDTTNYSRLFWKCIHASFCFIILRGLLKYKRISSHQLQEHIILYKISTDVIMGEIPLPCVHFRGNNGNSVTFTCHDDRSWSSPT